MTPKEKAKELVCKMHNSENCGIKHFPNENFCDCVEINLFQSKQCALIAVENEYHSLREQLFNLKSCSVDIPEKVYLFRIQALINEEQEVKIEIQEL